MCQYPVRRKLHFFRSQHGMSAMSLLLASALLVIAFAGMMQNSIRYQEGQQFLAMLGVRQDVARFVRGSIDCEETLNTIGSACDGATSGGNIFVPLKDSTGNTLVPQWPHEQDFQNSKLRLRATCADEGSYVAFSLAMQDTRTRPTRENSLTKREAHWKDALDGVPIACAKNQAPPTGPFGPCVWVDEGLCPANYAAFAMVDPAGAAAPPQNVGAPFQCCPVPANLLTNTHADAVSACPADHVVTGTHFPAGQRRLRCTQINTADYELSARIRGVWYVLPGCACISGQGSAPRRDWRLLPEVLRLNLMKSENYQDSPIGGTLTGASTNSAAHESMCVPEPGALMTERTTKYCDSFYAKRVHHRSTGLPVKMYPNNCTVNNLGSIGRNQVFGEVTCTDLPPHWRH